MGTKRKSKVDAWLEEDSLFLLSCWVREGLTDKEIAMRIGVPAVRLVEWKHKYEAIREAMKTQKEIVDYEVESALYRRAVGMKVKEVKTVIYPPDKNGDIHSRLETTEKEVLPDAMACIAWLNNRQPDKWKRNRDNFSDPNNKENITINVVKAAEGKVTLSATKEDSNEWEDDEWGDYDGDEE